MIPELCELRLVRARRTTTTVWHAHPVRQLECLSSGTLRVSFSDQTHDLAPGDLCLIAEGHLHRVEEPAGCAVHHGFVALTSSPQWFSPRAVESPDFDWLRGATVIVRQARDAATALKEIESWCDRADAKGRLVAQCLLVGLLARLESRQRVVIPTNSREDAGSGDTQRFEQAVRAIERLYQDPSVKVEAIARACCVSRSTLDKLFHRHLGYGPKEYLQRYRVDRARELLRLGRLSASQVAMQTGFADPFCFSRVFKRIAGGPPIRLVREQR